MEPMQLSFLGAKKANKASEILSGLVVDRDRAEELKSVFRRELELGMKGGLGSSCLQMENTFVSELTNGREEGSFVALDLGGTHFRVMLLTMSEGRIVEEVVKYYSVAPETRLGPGEALFDFLAECVDGFLSEAGTEGPALPLGFTFSFPMEQKGLRSGILVSWTKSFNCPDVVGRDAARMLREAIERRGSDRVEVSAILNDATGTLVKGAHDDPNTCIGLILGTGCNAAYLERAENVSRWGEEPSSSSSGHVIVDPEFGAFGDDGCIDFLKTGFDAEVDRSSLLPGVFTYEKYFAGKYLGDLARNVLRKLRAEGLLFEGLAAAAGCDDWVVSAEDVSRTVVEGGDDGLARRLVGGSVAATESDVRLVRAVCQVLSERCALLVAVPLAVFLDRLNRPADRASAIAVTGSLYRHHPTIKGSLERFVRELASGPAANVYTFNCEDGSGKGAGLVAAIAARLEKEGRMK